MAAQVETRMTAAEFFELPESKQPIELLEGELIMSPTPVPNHQRVVFWTAKVVEQLAPNGEVFIAPLDVYLDEDNVPQPDVMWVAEGSQCVIGEKRLEGPPDLVVEVFSPGTVRKDKRQKFKLYEKHGAREYWMMDPQEQYIEVQRLEDRRFVLQGVFEPGDTFESAVLGDKSVEVKALFGG